MISIAVEDFEDDSSESSEMTMRNLAASGCLVFQYASNDGTNAFELKISAISDGTRANLLSLNVSGTALLCDR